MVANTDLAQHAYVGRKISRFPTVVRGLHLLRGNHFVLPGMQEEAAKAIASRLLGKAATSPATPCHDHESVLPATCVEFTDLEPENGKE